MTRSEVCFCNFTIEQEQEFLKYTKLIQQIFIFQRFPKHSRVENLINTKKEIIRKLMGCSFNPILFCFVLILFVFCIPERHDYISESDSLEFSLRLGRV